MEKYELVTDIKKVERLIFEINTIHKKYSEEYFESGKIAKVNLKHTFAKVPVDEILKYRLNLHESINDYLMVADVSDISYFYRVKTSESILDKIECFTKRPEGYPVNSVLNDIFGARVILPTSVITEVMNRLDDWKEEYGLKNWYLKDTEDYTGIHVYFKNRSNFYYPWELQIWDKNDISRNIESHKRHKRDFARKLDNNN